MVIATLRMDAMKSKKCSMVFIKNFRGFFYLRLTTYDLRLVLLVFFISFASFGFSYQSATWKKIGSGIYEPAVVKLAADPHDPSAIFAATNKALYRSSDGGKQYDPVFQVSGEFEGINDIYIDPTKPQNIFAATDAGLYFSPDAGKHWQRDFYSSDERSRKCLALLRAGGTLYLGTGDGLLY